MHCDKYFCDALGRSVLVGIERNPYVWKTPAMQPKEIAVVCDGDSPLGGRETQVIGVFSALESSIVGRGHVNTDPAQPLGYLEIHVLIEVEADRHG